MPDLASRRLHQISTVLLLGVGTTALVISGGDVTSGQGATASQAGTPSFIAIDLNPSGFVESWAAGISGGQQVGDGSGPATGGQTHALLWRGTPASVVDLHPGGFVESRALGTSGGHQVGYGGPGPGRYYTHALLWSNSAASVVDLHPSGFEASEAVGFSYGQQVGWGWGFGANEGGHALVWRGDAASVVDFHPSRYNGSQTVAAFGEEQVGWGIPRGGAYSVGPFHALVWHGSAASVVDLHPDGFYNSWAVGTSGGEQVGYGSLGRHLEYEDSGLFHALVWRGSAARVVDLHPSGFFSSRALGTNGAEQVGWGAGAPTGNVRHALLWRGSAASVVDLHAFLPPGFVASVASGSDSTGDIVGVAWGPASDNRDHAFLWTRNSPKSGDYQGQHTITLAPAWAQQPIAKSSPWQRQASDAVSEGEPANAP